MRRYLMTGVIACACVYITGCTLRPATIDTSFLYTSDNDSDTTDETDLAVSSNDTQEDETTEEAAELPIDENGEWTDYILGTDVLDQQWEAPTFGELGCSFHVENYPVIYVMSDPDTESAINTLINEYVLNDYYLRFQMEDLEISLTCSVMSATSYVSYQLEGVVRHIGDDVRYEDEREYRYYFTIDRMTGEKLSLETVYGIERAYQAICDGEYEVVRAADSVFERFTDELLADVYINDPYFTDDEEHYLDYYIQDGALYVVIWVGEDNDYYAILRLEGELNL